MPIDKGEHLTQTELNNLPPRVAEQYREAVKKGYWLAEKHRQASTQEFFTILGIFLLSFIGGLSFIASLAKKYDSNMGLHLDAAARRE